jgi:hypothetical protein
MASQDEMSETLSVKNRRNTGESPEKMTGIEKKKI